MEKLVFATHNPNKLKEVQKMLPSYELLSLNELDITEEIKETGKTLEENAIIKAKYVYDNYQLNCFADDTGLEVKSLHGAPGVYSARYAGEPVDSEKNMSKLLGALENIADRSAQFRTVIALIRDGELELIEGCCKGEILKEKLGDKGFGYDPIFKPSGFDTSFAQMDMMQKAEISHRGIAVKKLVDLL